MRWWDGNGWTGHTTGTVVRVPGSPVEPYRAEIRMRWSARLGTVVYAGGAALNGLLTLAYASRWHQWWHEVWNIIQNPPPAGQTITLPAAPYPWWAYFALVSLAAQVMWLLWQYEAATAGRNLGIPSGCSPAWGVAGWFVPLANFWVPAQAIAGCLRPGHPLRDQVWKFWVAYVVNGFLSTSLLLTIPLVRPFGIVCLLLSLVLDGLILAGGWRVVGAVEEDHRLALSQAGWA
jgi:hypothetical protein